MARKPELLEQVTEGVVGGEEVRKEVGVISCMRPVSRDRLSGCLSAGWVATAGLKPVLNGSPVGWPSEAWGA